MTRRANRKKSGALRWRRKRTRLNRHDREEKFVGGPSAKRSLKKYPGAATVAAPQRKQAARTTALAPTPTAPPAPGERADWEDIYAAALGVVEDFMGDAAPVASVPRWLLVPAIHAAVDTAGVKVGASSHAKTRRSLANARRRLNSQGRRIAAAKAQRDEALALLAQHGVAVDLGWAQILADPPQPEPNESAAVAS